MEEEKLGNGVKASADKTRFTFDANSLKVIRKYRHIFANCGLELTELWVLLLLLLRLQNSHILESTN